VRDCGAREGTPQSSAPACARLRGQACLCVARRQAGRRDCGGAVDCDIRCAMCRRLNLSFVI
ncbi:MAG: hypothetical protein V1770_05085, partial [bacterium]